MSMAFFRLRDARKPLWTSDGLAAENLGDPNCLRAFVLPIRIMSMYLLLGPNDSLLWIFVHPALPQESSGVNDQAEFRHFRYLLAILQHRGFRFAAEYLGTSESNLSVQAVSRGLRHASL
jgi:hypothetical protein